MKQKATDLKDNIAKERNAKEVVKKDKLEADQRLLEEQDSQLVLYERWNKEKKEAMEEKLKNKELVKHLEAQVTRVNL